MSTKNRASSGHKLVRNQGVGVVDFEFIIV